MINDRLKVHSTRMPFQLAWIGIYRRTDTDTDTVLSDQPQLSVPFKYGVKWF